MSDIHQNFFKLYLMEQDGLPLSPKQQSELHGHLSGCPACRADLRVYQELRTQARLRLPATTAPLAMTEILHNVQLRARLLRAAQPLRALVWGGLALLVLALVFFIITSLRPTPAALPVVLPTPVRPTPQSVPTTIVSEEGKIPIQPVLRGDPYGSGAWSPEGNFFFIPIMDPAPPGGDRRLTSLHFISTATGEDCQASQLFPGQQRDRSYAWVDNNRVLFIDKQGRALLFTACQAGVQDLSDRFSEPLTRVALPYTSHEAPSSMPLFLEAPSAYWILDPVTLQARALAQPAPSPDLGDSFTWVPAQRQMLVAQPVAGQPELTRLVVLDLDSGEVLRSLEIEASNEGRAPLIEWAGLERPFVWSLGSSGPLMVDLSVDPPRQVRVFPDLFGFNLTYPDQISSIGVFLSPADNNFHVVAHVNLPDDHSVYVYHGENGRIEKLPGDRQMLMILPGDQRMPVIIWQDTQPYDDEYRLFWVDKPDRPLVDLRVSGHSPRNSFYLQNLLLPGSTRMLFGSTQGVSLVALPGGETLKFWRLRKPRMSASPPFPFRPRAIL